MVGRHAAARPVSHLCCSVFAAVVGLLFATAVTRAQSQDQADIAAGAEIFRQKADCQICHGWAGDGRKMDSQVPDGANLRQTRLDRPNLIMTIKCGRPPTGMPAFDKFAYSDGRCNGLKQSDHRAAGIRLPDPAATLSAREIENVTDFLIARIIGQGPMDHAKCVEFWGKDVEACSDFAK
jgi:hypothetical protein